MSSQQVERNRLKLQLEATIREINNEVINPELPALTMDDIKPILNMVARTRASYLKELFELTKTIGGAEPVPENMRKLASHRLVYEEILAASQALEAAIDRGYLDVKS